MIIDEGNPKHIIADEGKVLRRVVGFALTGKEIFLRKIKMDGVVSDDCIENYVEIDEPKEKEDK